MADGYGIQKSERVFVSLRLKAEDASVDRVWQPKQATANKAGVTEVVSSSGEYAKLDAVLPENSSGDDVYAAVAKRVVDGAVHGISGVVLAYGATSSGKTYTMQQVAERAAAELAERCGRMSFSALEVYNEELSDLLTSSHRSRSNAKPVRLLSSTSDNGLTQHTTVSNAREVSVESSHHLQRLIDYVQSRRTTGKHLMNERSSRSHLVTKLVLPNGADVHLVDLAGSERVAKTGSEGTRFREGANINRSLLTLGTVLKRLSDGTSNSRRHAPFRESKLTRLLAPALGGGARTSVICCASPAPAHSEQTRNTLAFALHARAVVNRLQVHNSNNSNDDRRERDREISMLRHKVQALTEELNALRRDRDERDRRARGLERLLLSPSSALTKGCRSDVGFMDDMEVETPRRRLSWPQASAQTLRQQGAVMDDVAQVHEAVEHSPNTAPAPRSNSRKFQYMANDDAGNRCSSEFFADQHTEPQPDTLWRENMLGAEADLRMQAWKQKIPPGLEEISEPYGSAQEEASRQLRVEEAAFRRAPGGLHNETTEARYERLRAEYDRLQGTGDDDAAADIADQLERVESQLETEREAESALSALQSKLSAMQNKLEKLAPGHENEAALSELSPNNIKDPSSAGSVGPSETSLSEDMCLVAPPSAHRQAQPNGNSEANGSEMQDQSDDERSEHQENRYYYEGGNSSSMMELQKDVGEIVNEGKLLENTLIEYKEHVERVEYQKRVLIAQAMRFEACLKSASEENSKLQESLRREKDAHLRAAQRLQQLQQHSGPHQQSSCGSRTLSGILFLWQELCIPLAHRAQFLHAFENKDAFYIEAEHRRLEWLKSSLSKQTSSKPTSEATTRAPVGHPLRNADKELAQERELLRRLIRHLPADRQRKIFERFDVKLASRYKRKQVADSLFSQSLEIEREKGSAELVCELLQYDTPHGTFGLLFAGNFARARLGPKMIANVFKSNRSG